MTRFVPVVVAAFFISVHYGTTIYLNSTLLENFFDSRTVSLLFILGALGNILIFLFAPKFIRQFGKRVLLVLSLTLAIASTILLALETNWIIVMIAFVTHASFFFINYYCLDIYLEELSADRKTGEIRGVYLTIVSLGIALGPLLVSFLTSIENDLTPVYLVAAVFLSIPLILTLLALISITPHKHHPYHHSAKLPFVKWWRAKDIRHATLARFILEGFYTFMIIYTPVYLHSVIGFSWAELGIIFTVMLLPFILFEWPAGELADRFWGEKEILITGFIIIILSLLLMPFIGKVFLLWMVVLFISRIGASLVEIMTESYFFKKIDASDAALISIFRLARPVSNILGAAIGILVLSYFSFEKIFFVIAIIVLIGLRESLYIKDTR